MSDRVTPKDQQLCVSTGHAHRGEPFDGGLLRRFAPELQRNIDLNILVPFLLSAELLTRDEEYTVTNPLLPHGERIRSLVSFVSAKGLDGVRIFLHSLRRSVDEHGSVAAGGHTYLDQILSSASQPTEQMVNHEAERIRIQQLELKTAKRFAALVEETYKQLVDKKVEDCLLKMFINALPIVCREEKKEIQKAENMGAIFCALSNCSCWGYRDTLLLDSIVKKFCDHHMAEKMDMYIQELHANSQRDHSVVPSPPLQHKSTLNTKFASLVMAVHEDFQNQQIDIVELRVYSTLLPTVLPEQYSHFEQEHLDSLAELDMTKLFGVLGSYWDYKTYQLLQCLVDRFGSPKLTEAVERYVDDFSKTTQSPEHTKSTELSETKKQVAQLKRDFAEIVIRFLEFLRKGPESTLDEVTRYLSDLPASTLLPEKKLLPSTISKVDSWCALFLNLTHSWDFLNCRTLQAMLKKFGNDQLNGAFEGYWKQRVSFLKQTTPGDLMAVLPKCQPPARRDYTKVTLVSSSSRWQEDNLAYFDTLVNTLATEFDLQAQCVMVYNAELNSPTSKLHFYLPTKVAGLLLIVNTEDKATFYCRHRVAHVELHESGHVYFDNKTDRPEELFMLACTNKDVEQRLELMKLKAKLQVSRITQTGVLSRNIFDLHSVSITTVLHRIRRF